MTPDGRFVWRAQKRNHALYLEARVGDEWLVTDDPCVLLQRTTAKEQRRRLIAAVLPDTFLAKHGAVVVENHLNMVRPIADRPHVSTTAIAAFLNSRVADEVFRCVSGSVAVSAYELESMPLPPPDAVRELDLILQAGGDRNAIDAACMRLYHDPW